MKKKNTWTILWVLLAALVIVLAFLPHGKKTDVSTPTKDVATQPSVEKKILNEVRKNDPDFLVDAEYPLLKFPSDKKIEDKVNQDIAANMKKEINAFGANVGQGLKDFATSSITIRYETEYLNKNIFSYAIRYSDYISGSAHPGNYVLTYTYDLATGDKIELSDLFKPGSNYLLTIADYARAEILSRFRETSSSDQTDWINTGTAAKVDNYKDFLVGKDGLVILFDVYQVAPGAAGEQRVEIPYATLERFIPAGGLLSRRGG